VRIKEVCEKTGLTRKAVRLYEEERLISPGIEQKEHNDYRDYSEKDLNRLLLIADLRSLRISIEDIRKILSDPKNCGEVFEKQKVYLKAEQSELKTIERILGELGNCSDLSVLAGRLQRAKNGKELTFSPDFSRFEELSEEERREFSDSKAVIEGIEKSAKIKCRLRWLAIAAAMAVLLFVGGYFYYENMEVGTIFSGGSTVEFIEVQAGDFGKEGSYAFAVLRFDNPPDCVDRDVLRLPFFWDSRQLANTLIPGGRYIGMTIRISLPRKEARELGLLPSGVFDSERALELFYTNEEFARKYGGITNLYSGYSAKLYQKDF